MVHPPFDVCFIFLISLLALLLASRTVIFTSISLLPLNLIPASVAVRVSFTIDSGPVVGHLDLFRHSPNTQCLLSR